MLAIRLQRTGRKGHAQFRVVVQDARRTPTSGRFVYLLGSYNPHSKTAQINTEKAQYYLDNGARPSDRAARLLKEQGVKLPKWVALETKAAKKQGAIRNPEKLRKNQPEQPEKAAAEVAPAEEAADTNQAPADQPAVEEKAETPAEEPAKTESE